MNKRTLGLLLLVAMLITAIPVAVSAETIETAPDVAYDNYDVEDLYVRDGLTAHFSVLGANSACASLEKGTWTDLISGKQALLGNKEYWQIREDGAVGFDILYGQLGTDGSVLSATDTKLPLSTDRYSSDAASGYAKTRLDLGIALLPKDDYTVEYVAKYNPIYVANPDGTVAENPDGTPMEYYSKTGHGLKDANFAGAQDALGFFSSWATERDGTHGITLSTRGAVLWVLSDTLPSAWNEGDPWIGIDANGGGGMRGTFHEKNGVYTYAITRDETVKEKNGQRTVTASYVLLRNGATFKKSLTVSTANTMAGRVYYDKDDTGEFYLSSQAPTDFYAVRVYDRVLSSAELAQNRLADLLLYYDLDIPKAFFAKDSLSDLLVSKVEDAGFLTDTLAREAFRVELQQIIDGEALREAVASLYAAPENLTSLFTTAIPGTVDLVNGKWYDLLSGDYATLGIAERWSFNAHGGIGFNTFCGQLDGAGNYTNLTAGNNYSQSSARLHFGLHMLPKDDFTVEYLAMYKPLYLYSTTAKDHVARDENGKPLETYDYDQSSVGLHLNLTPIDQLGWFSSYGAQLDGVGSRPWGEETRGSVHWLFNCPSWYHNPTGTTGWGHNYNWVWHDMSGRGISAKGGLHKVGDSYQQNDVLRVYSISLDETLTVADNGDRTTTGLFSLYRDSTLYNSNAGALNSTASPTETPGRGARLYVDIDTDFEYSDFFLSATRPTDFYTVRIYNKALTKNEMLHNRAADLLYYYGVDIPADLKDTPAVLLQIGTAQEAMPFATDALSFAANKQTLTDVLTAMTKTVNITLDGKTVDTISLIGTKMTLPMTVLGKQAIAWKISGVEELKKPGETVTVADNTVMTPTLISLPTTEILPTVRMTDKEADIGVRFAAAFARADYETLKSFYGKERITFGMLISPEKTVKRAGAFTREALGAFANSVGLEATAAYIQVDVPGFIIKDADTLLIRGGFYNFKPQTLEKNLSFAAVAFIDVDTDGDGQVDLSFYGNYITLANATVKETLQRTRYAFSATEQGWIDNLISRFGA